ncbi:hypothetical protein JX265_013342 [Neoarthrinium moseri]|uniref:Ribosomal protein L34 n=1 Tax=Neoarthrinium moseri TaxID=1658444 RepID=A0A9P9W8U2_9PEZI|nr:uncharacterized protein JN550_012221 [Neoarthrinium moseri]KAI1847217.1 hypothetical protein JX266_006757 [Neoarthrinium moseri]KAI1850779.1 hypothetical protein JX265_013342 [Neoarthrinium moseri]KAI1859208.1 hypothetical protein JN550_012221 [Neoarthrinium moseri]
MSYFAVDGGVNARTARLRLESKFPGVKLYEAAPESHTRHSRRAISTTTRLFKSQAQRKQSPRRSPLAKPSRISPTTAQYSTMAPITSSARVALSRATCSARTATANTQCLFTKRTFTTLPTLRPTLNCPSRTSGVFRQSTPSLSLSPSILSTASSEDATGATLDLVPRGAITSHPALGVGSQIRCGPRPTMAKTSRLIRKRRHGFLSRVRTRTGRRTLQRRRTKGRHTLSN